MLAASLEKWKIQCASLRVAEARAMTLSKTRASAERKFLASSLLVTLSGCLDSSMIFRWRQLQGENGVALRSRSEAAAQPRVAENPQADDMAGWQTDIPQLVQVQ